MKKRRNLIMSAVLCICLITSSLTPAYAWSNTKSKGAYSYYYGMNIGTLECRIWVSSLVQNLAQTKVTFDATSSSWVFNAKKSITKHVNTLKLEKIGLTGSLSVSVSKSVSASVTISENTEKMCEMNTVAANSYYRGITTYNNTITRGGVGAALGWAGFGLFTQVNVRGTSSQTVNLDGQTYTNSAVVRTYFQG